MGGVSPEGGILEKKQIEIEQNHCATALAGHRAAILFTLKFLDKTFIEIIRKMLELPDGHKVISCMVMGYSDVKYQRIPPRKDLQVKVL